MTKRRSGRKSRPVCRYDWEIVRRILFSLICGVSLLLFVATVAVWIRSFWFRDIVSYVSSNGNGRLIQSIRGRLHIITDLDGQSSGSFSHREDRLSPDAIWNGGMSGYP